MIILLIVGALLSIPLIAILLAGPLFVAIGGVVAAPLFGVLGTLGISVFAGGEALVEGLRP